MADAIAINEPNRIRFTALAALASGEIILSGDGRVVVVAGLNGFASGATAEGYTAGEFDVTSASGTTFSLSDNVYWDASANAAVTSSSMAGDFFLGKCQKAKISGETVVRVAIVDNGGLAPSALLSTSAVNLEHDDTTEYTLVRAADNQEGLIVNSFYGIVTEAMVGSSEDQMIIDLRDEDDNVLSQITAADAAADAIGDGLVGTLTEVAITSGSVAAVIPAGKSAYVVVSQATAGTPAGAIRVSAVVRNLL
jgi:predicted RecA/RadA family phage recombinase